MCDGLGERFYTIPTVSCQIKLLHFATSVAMWNSDKDGYYRGILESIAKHFNVNPNTPFKDIPQDMKDAFWNGSKETIEFSINFGSLSVFKKKKSLKAF